MTNKTKSTLCFTILISAIYLTAATNYVSKTGANVPPYDSWANAATTIQAAVTASGADDTILIGDGTYYPTNQIEIRDNRIIISANGYEKVVVDGGATNRCFYLYDNTTISGLTISNCYKHIYGGAAFLEGGIVSNCVFTHNSADYWGGAIYLGSRGTVLDSVFNYNSLSEEKGGAIVVFSGGLIRDCEFTYNSSTNYGGAVCCYQGGTVENCSFTRNSANFSKGGAVYCYKGGKLSNCTFDLNYSGYSGGAAYCYLDGEFISCTFNTNYSYGNGGAVYLNGGGILTNCTINKSSSLGFGGGVYCADDGKLQNCTLFNNYADEHGGGIFISGGTVDNCDIIDNDTAGFAAGIYCKDDSIIQNCLIAENWAVESAGGVYIENPCTFRRNIISNNFAKSGGGIMLSINTLAENCLINANRATQHGGGAYNHGATLQNCTIANNKSDLSGGGVYSYTGIVVNCILWNNNEEDYFNTGSEILYNCIDGWTNIQNGIITNNPMFYSETDFRLLEGSTSLNSGTNLPGLSSQKDLNGNPRVIAGKVDMGCYQGAIPEPGLFIIYYFGLWIIYSRRPLGPGSSLSL